MIQTLGLVWLLSKLWYVIYIVLYRIAIWSGTIYLYKKGKQTKNKFYYLLAIGIYLLSWELVWVGSSKLLQWLHWWGK